MIGQIWTDEFQITNYTVRSKQFIGSSTRRRGVQVSIAWQGGSVLLLSRWQGDHHDPAKYLTLRLTLNAQVHSWMSRMFKLVFGKRTRVSYYYLLWYHDIRERLIEFFSRPRAKLLQRDHGTDKHHTLHHITS
jgi:hypothetical protein